MRLFALLLGLICLGLGVIGAFVPLMPSTVFFIVAVGCFAYASPRLEKWLMSFPFIAAPVQAWRERGAIALPAKILASIGMAAGFGAFALTGANAWALAAAAVFLALCAAFVWTRPS
ncbi:YbaN family protein [Vitreimonas sp.]|uniref:YbaN family protein n=1 Tax=Vitreimonas sp. TaxID=3069702 RepID=UPI002D76EEEB|nr:YbaN family protein [Vitreimonas sp.]